MEVKNSMTKMWKCDGGCGSTFEEDSVKKFLLILRSASVVPTPSKKGVVLRLDLCSSCLEALKLPKMEDYFKE